ncbi:hypothetical protein RQP46_010868 [Phenoliferia psychrophenolica]
MLDSDDDSDDDSNEDGSEDVTPFTRLTEVKREEAGASLNHLNPTLRVVATEVPFKYKGERRWRCDLCPARAGRGPKRRGKERNVSWGEQAKKWTTSHLKA